MEWYADHVRTPDGLLRCVGNVWHRRGEDPRVWQADDGDEQPIDAGAFAEAFVEAWRYRGHQTDAKLAGLGLSWFLGSNRAGLRMYVDQTGACHDGMSLAGVNGNQGAESTLAYYQALLAVTRSGLGVFSDQVHHHGAAAPILGTGRTLTGRAITSRPTVTDRSSAQRVRPPATAAAAPLGTGGTNTGGAGAAPTVASPANRSSAGHRPRTPEGHPDAR